MFRIEVLTRLDDQEPVRHQLSVGPPAGLQRPGERQQRQSGQQCHLQQHQGSLQGTLQDLQEQGEEERALQYHVDWRVRKDHQDAVFSQKVFPLLL